MARFVFVLFVATCVFGSPRNIRLKNEKIVGGKEATLGQFPYQAELSLNGGRRHHCGGTILNERWILTAAHCVDELEPEDFTIKLGTTTLNSNFTTYLTSKIIPHPSYNSTNKQNDIALLYTTSPIKFSRVIQPITLPQSSPAVGSDVTASGWGYLAWEADAQVPNELHYVTLKTIATEECAVKMAGVNVVSDWQICTLTRSGEGVCGGDSGGPLAYKGELVGVVSWGLPCGDGYPDVFTRVPAYLKWIQDNIE